MSKRRRQSQWLDDIHAAVDAHEPSEIIIPSVEGSVHIAINKADIDQHFRRQKRHRRLIAYGHQMAMLALALAGSAAFVLNLDQKLGAYLARAEVEEIAEDKRAVEQAFSLYAQYTRDIVAEYRDNLSSEVEQLGTSTPQVLRAAGQTTGTGGTLDAEAPVAKILDQYIDRDSAEQLHEVARLNHFLEQFPAYHPLAESHITSGFGMRKHPVTGRVVPHRGTDLVSYKEPDVLAAGDGRVVFAGRKGQSGKMVRVDHGAGIETLYLHLASIDVEQGEGVSAGDVIGVMGETGQTDGAHLHFEIRVAGQPIDAAKMLRVASRGD